MRWTMAWSGLLAMVLSAGGALGTVTSGIPHARSSSSTPHTIHALHMSVTVPAAWRTTGKSTSSGTTTWTIAGQWTSTPRTPTNPDQLLPLQPGDGGVIPSGESPYQERSTGYSGYERTEQFIAANGTQYRMVLDMYNRPASSPVAQQILKSWRHLPVMTTTKAVTRLEHLQNGYDTPTGYNLSYANSRDGWLLVAGPPATAQESYYLFHTVNSGKTWQLERYTIWAGCLTATEPAACAFLRSAGETSMRFWSGSDGMIALADFATPEATIYRTVNGGNTWSVKTLPLPQQPEGIVLRRTATTLIITVTFYGRPRELWTSTNGGQSWALA